MILQDRQGYLMAVLLMLLLGFGLLLYAPSLEAETGISRLETPADISGTRLAILTTEGFHDGETTRPRDYLAELGVESVIIGPETGEITAYNSDLTLEIEKTVEQAEPADFDSLLLPGGQAPGELREQEQVLDFVREFAELKRPIAAICHGPQVLISAGLMTGKRATGYSGISGELQEAGIDYESRVLVRDGRYITSRIPEDIPLFKSEIARALAGEHRRVNWHNESENLTLEVAEVSDSEIFLSWVQEIEGAASRLDQKIEEGLILAAEEYDEDDDFYSLFTDPEFQKIEDGDWAELGLEDEREVMRELLTKIALTGPRAPDRDPDEVKKTLEATDFYNIHLSSAYRNELEKRYYENQEQALIYYAAQKYEELADFSRKPVETHQLPADDLWLSSVRLDLDEADYVKIVTPEGESDIISIR